MSEELSVFWFRRDLRLNDNPGLWHALTSGYSVMPVFIFDRNIIDGLEPDDRRMTYLRDILATLDREIKKRGSSLQVFYGNPLDVFTGIAGKYRLKALYFNRDYEPYGISRDKEITGYLAGRGVQCFSYKDHVIFEGNEVMKNDGKPYTVFTPYSSKWLSKFDTALIGEYPSERLGGNFAYSEECSFITPSELGFKCPPVEIRPFDLGQPVISAYASRRDYPFMNGTSNIGQGLRFGTVSIREVFRKTQGISETFAKELIWREFFMNVLSNFPRVTDESFRPEFDRIEWVNDEEKFNLWCEGKTGFPIIDAGMRELRETGYMHNRVRMITANFLTRHLLTDWRWGETWFAGQLLDYELSSDNGNWQWAAGSGCDAAQYFRIFNPDFQLRKYDPASEYARKWIPELGTPDYPGRCADISATRVKALEIYRSGINS